jgi:hypothetical protein
MASVKEALVQRMTGSRWSRVNLRGIAPYTIDRVDGEATIQRPWAWGSRCVEHIDVRAYDVRCPDGSTFRFARLKDAKTFIVYHSNHLVIPAALAAGVKVC